MKRPKISDRIKELTQCKKDCVTLGNRSAKLKDWDEAARWYKAASRHQEMINELKKYAR